MSPSTEEDLRRKFKQQMAGIEPGRFRSVMIACIRKGEWEQVQYCINLLITTGSQNILGQWEWARRYFNDQQKEG